METKLISGHELGIDGGEEPKRLGESWQLPSLVRRCLVATSTLTVSYLIRLKVYSFVLETFGAISPNLGDVYCAGWAVDDRECRDIA